MMTAAKTESMHDPVDVASCPLISVALCTCNGERYLRPLLDSLLAQDYPKLEIIAVDDASSDDSGAILQAAAQRDKRVQVHRNAHNLGFSGNFEKALGLCSGAFIAPCDQDDLWAPHKLNRLQQIIGDTPMTYCDSRLIDALGRDLGQTISGLRNLGDIDDPASIVFGTCVFGHAMLFRRELLEQALPFPDNMSHDQWLSCVAACQGTLRYCDAALVGYRQHEGAIIGVTGLHRDVPDPPGHKLASIVEVGTRIQWCAAHCAPRDRAFFTRLARLWPRWMRYPLCIALPLFLFRHRRRLFATFPGQHAPYFHRTFKYVWGLPVRRLIQPRHYGTG